MRIGPKFKIAKRLGAPIFEKTQTQKYTVSEARAQKTRSRRPGAMSDYKRQLLEKQKMRYSYGVSERQLRRYVNEAIEHSDEPTLALFDRLERRADNVVYRLGLAKTRQMARQMVAHGHICINGRRITTPAHAVSSGDTINVREGSKESGLFTTLEDEHAAAGVPAWLTFDLKTLTGSVSGAPHYDPAETLFDPEQVLEYYSR